MLFRSRNVPSEGLDLVLVRVEVVGSKAGKTSRITFDIIDKADEATGLSAMMRTTAFPASIIAQMMVRGDVTQRGAVPQEIAIDSDTFVKELGARGIAVIER